jgi:hypothetical protein
MKSLKYKNIVVLSLIVIIFIVFACSLYACLMIDANSAVDKTQKAYDNWEKSKEQADAKRAELEKAISDYIVSQIDPEGTFVFSIWDILTGKYTPPNTKIKNLKQEVIAAETKIKLYYKIWETWLIRYRSLQKELRVLEQKISNLKQDIESLKSQISDLKEQVEKEKNEQGGSPGSEASNKLSELEAKLKKKEAELETAIAEHGC